MSNPFSGRACVHGLHLKHISHCSPISKHGSHTTAAVKQNDVTQVFVQEFIPSCSSHSDANYVCCREYILESGTIFARPSLNFQLSTLDTLFSTIFCCPWRRDRWLPTKSPLFTRPLLQNGSSLHEERLSVRQHFFLLQIFNNLMV